MNILSKTVRIITVPPLIAAVTATLLYFLGNNFFSGISHYIAALAALTVFPLLAYPISLIKPAEVRRSFQRRLAIILSVTGYIAGFVFALVTDAVPGETVLFSTYLLSGILTALSTFILKIKSSGHACGVSGPAAVLSYYLSPWFLLSYLLLIPVFWSSLRLGRHTVPQLISGSVIPVICLFISILIFT